MTTGATTAAVAAQQAIQNAIKASGAIVKIESNDFSGLLNKMDNALVIESAGGVFTTRFKYLTSYKGFIFYTKSREKLSISSRHELISSSRIWVPE